jgi:hypothetical protein
MGPRQVDQALLFYEFSLELLFQDVCFAVTID